MGTACSPAYAQMLLLPPCSNLIKGHVQNSDAKTMSMSWTPNPLTLTYFWGKNKQQPLLMSAWLSFVTNFSGKMDSEIQNVILDENVLCYGGLFDDLYYCIA